MRVSSSLSFGALLAVALPLVQAALDMRLVAYNVRYDAAKRERYEKPWSVRQPLMAAQLNHIAAGRPNTLICTQEGLHHQVKDLHYGLGEDWAWVGVGRDDGAMGGEFSTIYFRPSAWELTGNKTYWLSPTPDVPGSKGWDAMLPRIVTVAKFKHRSSGEPFVYMCTHFDHVGRRARQHSAELLVNLAHELSVAHAPADKPVPVFLGGDLNSPPTEKAYKTLASKLGNVRDKVPERLRIGNTNTYTAFTESRWDDEELDFIFVRDETPIEWVSFAVPNSRFDDRIYISDHRPVIVDFKLKK